MAKPLTDTAASAAAVYRWGDDGRAWHPASEHKGGGCWCCVGTSNGRLYPHQWVVYGIGPSWEEAFSDADARGTV